MSKIDEKNSEQRNVEKLKYYKNIAMNIKFNDFSHKLSISR